MAIDATLRTLLEGQSLSMVEAETAMREIMDGEVSPVKLAAWLVALRMKGESSREIAGCAKTMLSRAVKIPQPFPDAVDTCGTGGDGLNTMNISTAAAFVAAGAGVAIAKHGNKAASSKSGSADVLSSLGVSVSLHPERAVECLEKIGMAFFFAPSFHPAMKQAAPVRKELGIRTIFNILGPLCNPAGAKRAVLGVYADSLCRKMTEAAKELGFKHMMSVHGADGLDEISICAKTHICELRDGKIDEYMFCPGDYGFAQAQAGDISGGTPADNAALLKEILSGTLQGAKRDIVVLNAAAAILVAGKASSWEEAFQLANASIDSGSAFAKLGQLVAFTNATT